MKETTTHTNNYKTYITWGIVLIAFLIRFIRLDMPHEWSFDEVYHGLSAEAYALNDPRGYEWWNQSPKDLSYEWLHPPLGKVFMAMSIKLFAKPYIPESKAQKLDGRTTFAWRFPGVVAAAITVYLLIIFGEKLFGNILAGWIAGGLYALDGLSFVQSRTGMNDIYIALFVVFAFYRLYLFIAEYPKKITANLLWLGLASGLAASTKWTGFYAVGIVFAWGVLFVFRKRALIYLSFLLFSTALYSFLIQRGVLNLASMVKNPVESPVLLVGVIWVLVSMLIGVYTIASKETRRLGVHLVINLAILPFLVYLLSYGQWWVQAHRWGQFEELHKQIWWYQTGLKATHDYQSKAYTWPVLYRPVWFYVKYEDHFDAAGKKELWIGNIYTMGNPLIWWSGLLAIFYMMWVILEQFFTGRALKMLMQDEVKGKVLKVAATLKNVPLLPLFIVLVGYFGMFLPWVASPRIMFMYHYLPSVPFLCLALAYVLLQIKNRFAYGAYIVTIFLSLVVLLFVYFYPHWTGLPLPTWWVNQYYWLKTWK